MPGLLDRRLIFVTGKGGVGKSTVAVALGLLAARRGLRTIVAELASQDRARRTFHQPGVQYAEVELGHRLFTISIDPQHAMEEYLRVKTGAVGHALGSTKLFGAFAMATPGMRELLSMGKVWELAQPQRRTGDAAPYDLVIVDAPATGHGVGLLRTPRTFAEIARVGPIARQGRAIADTIADRGFTAVIAVSTAAEMPVNETLALRDALSDEDLPLDAVIVNALYPQRFSASDGVKLRATLARSQSPTISAAIGAALSEQARAHTQQVQLARLREGLATDVMTLPYLFSDQIAPPELELLANVLGKDLARHEALAVSG